MTGIWRKRQPAPDDAAKRNNAIMLSILIFMGGIFLVFLFAKWMDIESGRCLDCVLAEYGISDYDVGFYRWAGRVLVPSLIVTWIWLIVTAIRSTVTTDRTVIGTICWFLVAIPVLMAL